MEDVLSRLKALPPASSPSFLALSAELLSLLESQPTELLHHYTLLKEELEDPGHPTIKVRYNL